MNDLIKELEELIQLINEYQEEERRLLIENRNIHIDLLIGEEED